MHPIKKYSGKDESAKSRRVEKTYDEKKNAK
jgi:hypothetical protein